jgi:hypothetical protein
LSFTSSKQKVSLGSEMSRKKANQIRQKTSGIARNGAKDRAKAKLWNFSLMSYDTLWWMVPEIRIKAKITVEWR